MKQLPDSAFDRLQDAVRTLLPQRAIPWLSQNVTLHSVIPLNGDEAPRDFRYLGILNPFPQARPKDLQLIRLVHRLEIASFSAIQPPVKRPC